MCYGLVSCPLPWLPVQDRPSSLAQNSYHGSHLHCLHSVHFPLAKKTCLQNQVSLESWQVKKKENFDFCEVGDLKGAATSGVTPHSSGSL